MGHHTKRRNSYGTGPATREVGEATLEATQDFKVTLDNTARPSQVRTKFEFHLYVSSQINFTTCKLL